MPNLRNGTRHPCPHIVSEESVECEWLGRGWGSKKHNPNGVKSGVLDCLQAGMFLGDVVSVRSRVSPAITSGMVTWTL